MGETTNVGNIGLNLVVNKNGFEKQMSGIQNLAKKTGLTLAAAFSVKKIVDFGKSCLDLGSDLQEVQNVVDVTFQTMSKKVDFFAKSAVSSFGLSETMAKKFTGTFGAMAKAFGFSEEQAYNMGTALTGLAGDVASFYNITQDEAYTKLKSVFTGETESLKDLGVVMTQTALDSYALANGYGKVTSKMSEAEKVALRYAFVTDQLSTASGDFIRTSDGWANQLRVLNLQFDSLKATIGQGLISALTPVIKWINTLLSRLNLLASYFSAFTKTLFGSADAGSETASAVSGIAAAASAASSGVDGVTKAVEKLKKSTKVAGFDELNVLPEKSDEDGDTGADVNVAGLDMPTAQAQEPTIDTSAVEKSAEKLKSIFAGLESFIAEKKGKIIALAAGLAVGITACFTAANWGKIVTTVTGAISKIGSIFAGLASGVSLPALAIAAVIGLIVAAIVDLWNSSERFRDNMKQAWELISTAVVQAWNMLWDEGLKPLIDAIVQLGTSIYELYENGGLKTLFEFVVTGVTWVASILGSVLVTTVSAVLTVILNAIEGLIKALTWIIDKITWVCANWSEIWGNIKESASNFIENIVTCITTWIENLKEAILFKLQLIKLIFFTIFTAIKESTANFIEKIVTGITKWIEDLKEAISSKLQLIKLIFSTIFMAIKISTTNFIEKLVTGITTCIDNMKEGISNKLKLIKLTFLTIFTAIKSSTMSIFNGIWNGIKKTINSILGGIETMANGVIRGVNRIVSALNNLSFDIPEWVPEYGGKTFGFNIPELSEIQIPRLASGGYVKANTPQLAMIGDNKQYGEIVSPEDKMYEISFQAMMDALKQFLQMFQMSQPQQGSGDVNLIVKGDLAPLIRLLKIELEKEGMRVGKNFEVVTQ